MECLAKALEINEVNMSIVDIVSHKVKVNLPLQEKRNWDFMGVICKLRGDSNGLLATPILVGSVQWTDHARPILFRDLQKLPAGQGNFEQMDDNNCGMNRAQGTLFGLLVFQIEINLSF